MTSRQTGILYLLAAISCWGPAPVFTKLALEQIPPLTFAFLGRLFALIILFAIFYPRGFFKVEKKDLFKIISAGLLGSFFNVGFFVFGIRLTNAMDAQAIFTVVPIFTTILAYFLLKEKIKAVQLIGVVIGFLGAMLIATRDYWETGSLHTGNIVGNSLIFLSALSFVGFILLSRSLTKKYSPVTVTCYAFLASSLLFAPLALLENITQPGWVSNLTIQGYWGLFYVSIFASVLAFNTYQMGLKLTSAFMAGVILYLQPIVTTIFAEFFLHEKITPTFLLATLLVIIGSLIASQYELMSNTLRKRFPKI